MWGDGGQTGEPVPRRQEWRAGAGHAGLFWHPAYSSAGWCAGLSGDCDLLLVEGDIARVVLADPVKGGRVRVGVAPRRVVVGGTGHRDVVVLGDALPPPAVRRRAVTEHAGAERGGREVIVALDGDQVGLRSIRNDRAVDGGLHVPFPSSEREISQVNSALAVRLPGQPARPPYAAGCGAGGPRVADDVGLRFDPFGSGRCLDPVGRQDRELLAL